MPASHIASSPTTARQEELLVCALDLVREGGLAKLTVRRLSRRMGFSEAALYRHYPSKESLLLALLDRLTERLLGPIRQLAGETDRPPTERLIAILRHHVQLVLEVDGLPMLLLLELSTSGSRPLRERLQRVVDDYAAVLEPVVAELGELPEGRSPQELVLLLLGLPMATAMRRRLRPTPALERKASGELVEYYVRRLTGS